MCGPSNDDEWVVLPWHATAIIASVVLYFALVWWAIN